MLLLGGDDAGDRPLAEPAVDDLGEARADRIVRLVRAHRDPGAVGHRRHQFEASASCGRRP